MAAILQKIPSLIGGVSQQPDSLKLNNQLRECTNYYPDPTFGLDKRPGLRGIRRLTNATSNGTWFTLFRDEEEKYIIEFSKAGVLRIWDADSGIEQTVNTPAAGATAYATHTDTADLTVLQINDYTFVLNRKVVVAEESGVTSPTITPFGFVSINTVAYATDYFVIIDGTTFSYSSPNTTTTQLSVGTILNALVSSINANPAYVATAVGNSIHIRRANNADFSLEARGGTTGTAIQAYKGVVSVVSELPTQFINGAKIKVQASENSDGDDYWVVFETSNGGAQGSGSWVETIAGGVVLNVDAATLPHVIIREANGTFTFRKLDQASATATPSTATVSGVPQSVSILTSGNGRYAVGQSFPVYGGTGLNLRLRVTATRTDVTNTDYTWAPGPSSYVERIVYVNGSQTYNWYLNGEIFRTTTSDSSFEIGNNGYSVLGSYNTVASGDPNITLRQEAGLRITTVTPGVIDGVEISRAGRNYTALDTVTSMSGDTFRVDTVASVTLNVDSIAKQFWKPREVGDNDTNPMPSFVGNPIHGIAFFKNRLIFMSRENVISSQAGDYFNFFASTVLTIVASDPIDLSCGSLKPLELRHSIQTTRGLVMFADNTQYILETTTEAFSAATAEINSVSNYNQSPRIAPVDTGPSIVFLEESDSSTQVFEMLVGDSVGSKPAVVELTRIIPSYIPADVKELKVSSSATTFAMVTYREPDAIYLFRFFNDGNERRMASWFKWVVSGPVEMIEFDHDRLFVVTKQNSNYVLSHVELLTETAAGAVFFDGAYVDLRLDLLDYNPTKVYFAGTDTTHICFKDGFNDSILQPVLVSLDPLSPGTVQELSIQTDLTQPVGQRYFVEVDGDQTASRFALGYKYVASATLPAFYVIGGEGKKDTLNVPMVNRMSIDSYNSGPYTVTVKADGRDPYTVSLPQIIGNLYPTNTVPMLRNAQNKVPVMAKGTQVEVSLIADSPFPTSITSLTWEGTYNNRGVKSV
jgi:hypothetical protein